MKRTIHTAEKISSLILLTILAGIAGSILYVQADYSLAPYGFSLKQNKTGTRPSKKIDTSVLSPEGYKFFSSEKEFDAVSLYEKINGKAPLYLKSGFKKLITRRYIHKKNDALWFEIYFYDMASLKNAFSVYSRQRRINAQYATTDMYTYETENSKIFIRNNYYIELIGATANSSLLQAINKTAEQIKKQLGSIRSIKEVEMLKNKYHVKGSSQYYTENAFGIDGLTRIFTAKYKIKNSTTTVFISGPFKKEEDIIKAMKRYKNFYKKEGAGISSSALKLQNMAIINYDGSFECLFSAGKYMCGVHEAESQKEAENYAHILSKTLTKNGGINR